MDPALVLLILLFAAVMIAVYFVNRSISTLRKNALADISEAKKKRQADYLAAKAGLEDLMRRKVEAEHELYLAKCAAEERQSASEKVAWSLTPEDWLLKEGHLTLEHVAKAKEIKKKTASPVGIIGMCVMLGYVSNDLAQEAIKKTKPVT